MSVGMPFYLINLGLNVADNYLVHFTILKACSLSACQKRPIIVSRETYYSVKRDLHFTTTSLLTQRALARGLDVLHVSFERLRA